MRHHLGCSSCDEGFHLFVPVKELCGPSRKRSSEESGGFTSIPPADGAHAASSGASPLCCFYICNWLKFLPEGYLSGAAEVEVAHKRTGPLFQEEAEPVSTGASLMTQMATTLQKIKQNSKSIFVQLTSYHSSSLSGRNQQLRRWLRWRRLRSQSQTSPQASRPPSTASGHS